MTPLNTVVGHCFSDLAESGKACVYAADVFCIGSLEECGETTGKIPAEAPVKAGESQGTVQEQVSLFYSCPFGHIEGGLFPACLLLTIKNGSMVRHLDPQ